MILKLDDEEEEIVKMALRSFIAALAHDQVGGLSEKSERDQMRVRAEVVLRTIQVNEMYHANAGTRR